MGGGYLRLTNTSLFCIIKKNRNILRVESGECMKYLKISLLIITSLFIGMSSVQALTEEEVLDLQEKGDIYGLINYQEELPTENTSYRITMQSPFEKYTNEVMQGYMKLNKEEYDYLLTFQNIMDQHQNQYKNIFKPLWDEMIEILVQLGVQEDELYQLEELLSQTTEEEKKQELQKQIDEVNKELENLNSKYETIESNIESHTLKIDDSIKEAITKVSSFMEKKYQNNQPYEIVNNKVIEITSPGYYIVSSTVAVYPEMVSTYLATRFLFADFKLIEVPETPKEEVVDEPDIKNPSTGVQSIIIGGGMILICSITGMYFIRKKKLFVK